jgi:hypothetical protein
MRANASDLHEPFLQARPPGQIGYFSRMRTSKLAKRIFRKLRGVVEPQHGSFAGGVYSMTRTNGFFSEISTALSDLARLGRLVRSIDSQDALQWYKDDPAEDLFSEIFDRPRGRVKGSLYLRRTLPHHSVYCRLPFEKIAPLAQNWFSPSREIKLRAATLGRTWGVRPEEMIAVNLRGSEKYEEVEPTPVTHWVEVVSQLKTANPSMTVAVCSDDQDLVDQFTDLADFEVIDLRQNLRTTGGSSIAGVFQEARERSEETKNFVAQTWLISQARIVVTHTGNTAYWTSIFRGCHWGLFQFTTSPGELAFSLSRCRHHSTHGGPVDMNFKGELVEYVRF